MNNIPGVSYPIDENVRDQLRQRPALARLISLRESDRSNLEIIRLLGNTQYGHIRDLHEFLEKSVPVANALVDELLKQTDPMEFAGKLAELYLLWHIEQRIPGQVTSASGRRSEKRPDLLVCADSLDIAIEIYGPMNLFGFQLVQSYAIRILKYLEIDRGYSLSVNIEPDIESDLFYAYRFETEKEIRPWLREFAKTAGIWLLGSSPQPVLQKEGPNASGWRLSVAIEELHDERDVRTISQSTAARSDDPRLYFEIGTAEDTANGWWGRLIKRKMSERQAGPSPNDSRLRVLVVDFARLDTGFPDFICWPNIAKRIDSSVRLLASWIGGDLPYDVVLPARLGPACCFGSPVWLGEDDTGKRQDFFKLAGLTVPCEDPTEKSSDWLAILTE